MAFFPACVAGVIFNKVFSVYGFSTFGNKLQLSLLMSLFPLVLKRSGEQLLVDTRSCPSPLRVPSLRVCDSIRVLVLLCLLGKLWLYLAQQTGVCWFSVDAFYGSVFYRTCLFLCVMFLFLSVNECMTFKTRTFVFL